MTVPSETGTTEGNMYEENPFAEEEEKAENPLMNDLNQWIEKGMEPEFKYVGNE